MAKVKAVIVETGLEIVQEIFKIYIKMHIGIF